MSTTNVLDEETSKKVIRQVEFYFSDSNLPRDNFLRKTLEESEDGLVSLALICSFSRMRGHLGIGDVKADDVSEDTVKAVADTLRTSDFLKISEDGKKVGRRSELNKPEEVIEQVDSRTIAAAPLPYDVKLEDVESFFSQFAKVNSIRLPRLVSHKNLFCGTALVEYSTEEDAEKIMAQNLTYAGADLELKPKKDFDAEREKLEEAYEKSGRGQGKSKSSEEANYPKGLIVAFTLKSKSSGDESKQNGSAEHASEAEVSKTNGGESVTNGTEEADKAAESDKNGTVEDADEAATGTPDEEEKETEGEEKSSDSADKKDVEKAAPEGRNAVESYKDNMDVVIREDLKALFQKFGTVKYIDFKMGESSGYIRFEEPEASQKARAAAVLTEDGGLVVKNFIAALEPVTGDQEKEYWSQIQGSQGKFRDNRGGHRGRGGKFNRGGRHGRPRDRDSPAGRFNKAQKVAV
ncbi:la protein 1-like [Chenopodium quinoa]|uniref:La protein 1 n=1 Tax=Chenopodium quinoa TaxID=63459 RepID=A0A803LBT7_CHEQI|nr:la protein 1-like [Chenopodium quinoa]